MCMLVLNGIYDITQIISKIIHYVQYIMYLIMYVISFPCSSNACVLSQLINENVYSNFFNSKSWVSSLQTNILVNIHLVLVQPSTLKIETTYIFNMHNFDRAPFRSWKQWTNNRRENE